MQQTLVDWAQIVFFGADFRLWHSRAGGGAVHSIKSEHQPSHSIKFAGVSQPNSTNPTAIRPAITAATATKKLHPT
jgi:hypothetical protein